MYEELNSQVAALADKRQLGNLALLSRDFHVLPDFHGNRSPVADPNMTGMVMFKSSHYFHFTFHRWHLVLPRAMISPLQRKRHSLLPAFLFLRGHKQSRGVSRKFRKRGPKQFWRECNIAPHPQHMNILGVIAQFHSKDGYLQNIREKRGTRPPPPPPQNPHMQSSNAIFLSL